MGNSIFAVIASDSTKSATIYNNSAIGIAEYNKYIAEAEQYGYDYYSPADAEDIPEGYCTAVVG